MAAIKYLKYVVFEVRIFKYVADLFIEVIMIDLLPWVFIAAQSGEFRLRLPGSRA